MNQARAIKKNIKMAAVELIISTLYKAHYRILLRCNKQEVKKFTIYLIYIECVAKTLNIKSYPASDNIPEQN